MRVINKEFVAIIEVSLNRHESKYASCKFQQEHERGFSRIAALMVTA